MNIVQKFARDIKAKRVLWEADKIQRDYPELTYRECFTKALEVFDMTHTEIYKRWSEEQ